MNDNELELLLTKSLENTKEPNTKLNLVILNEAKIKCNREYQSKQDQKSLVLALSIFLPFSIIAAMVVSYLFISNFIAKLMFWGIGIAGIICILTVSKIAYSSMKNRKGVLVE